MSNDITKSLLYETSRNVLVTPEVSAPVRHTERRCSNSCEVSGRMGSTNARLHRAMLSDSARDQAGYTTGASGSIAGRSGQWAHLFPTRRSKAITK